MQINIFQSKKPNQPHRNRACPMTPKEDRLFILACVLIAGMLAVIVWVGM
jgi:hypothetical protein